MTDKTEALPPLERAIDDYLDGYVLEGDDGYHLPTEHEKLIVKDAIMGLLEEPAFRAALAQRQQVPEGWQLVPVEPTDAMVEAARDVKRRRLLRAVEDTKAGREPNTAGAVMACGEEWAAMLAAAPALTAAPSAQAEPVAWRYVPSKVWNEYVYTDKPEAALLAREYGVTLEPLYATPPAAQAEPQED